MERLSDKELDMLIDLHQEKYCESALDYVIEKAAKELKELREFKAIYQKEMDYSYATFMYNKAIDDFIKKLEEHEHNNWVDHLEYGITWDDIEQIANELKEHKTLNIVHCKDCKHWGTDIAGETENIKCCEYGKYMVGENGYCVYGEKECEK